MNYFNQGNSQGGSQGQSQGAPAGSRQSDAQPDAAQDLGIAAEELAFGEVRRADLIRQRQGGNEGQGQQ